MDCMAVCVSVVVGLVADATRALRLTFAQEEILDKPVPVLD